jgi:hypothetical protein
MCSLRPGCHMVVVWRRRVKRTIFPLTCGPITRWINTSMDYQPAPIDTREPVARTEEERWHE